MARLLAGGLLLLAGLRPVCLAAMSCRRCFVSRVSSSAADSVWRLVHAH